jgi:hypothetical protein
MLKREIKCGGIQQIEYGRININYLEIVYKKRAFEIFFVIYIYKWQKHNVVVQCLVLDQWPEAVLLPAPPVALLLDLLLLLLVVLHLLPALHLLLLPELPPHLVPLLLPVQLLPDVLPLLLHPVPPLLVVLLPPPHLVPPPHPVLLLPLALPLKRIHN